MSKAPAALVRVMASLLAVLLMATPVVAEARPGSSGEALPRAGGEVIVPKPVDTAQPPIAPQDAPVSVLTATVTPTRPVSVRFEGILTEVSMQLPAEWRVDDITFRVISQTVIIVPVPGYAPRIGDYAIVSATREGATLTATRIQIRSQERPIEFRGIITALPAAPFVGDWRVSGVTVTVDSRATVIINQPSLYYYADVKGWLKQGRQVLAASITVLDPAAVAAGFEFEGIIEEIPPTGEGIWVISGVRGLVSSDTHWEGILPRVGATAEIDGRVEDGALVFQRIRVLSEAQREVRIRGAIEEMQADYWVVAGQRLEIEDTTFIDESRATAARGMWAEVIARRESDGLLYALRIRVERPD
jgi:hypothetical protein